jgi:protein-disulfide isomerase
MLQRLLASMCVVFAICIAAVRATEAQTATEKKPTAAAEVNGLTITDAEVEEGVAQSLAKLEEQIYNIKRARVDALIDDRLLAIEAKKRGITTTALIDAEITSKVTPPEAAEVSAFYETNKAKLQGDLAKWEEQIRTYLKGQRVATRRQAFVKQLRDAADVKVLLTPPPIYRATVPVGDAPVRGAASAPVTIVEYSDFHCPFCRQIQPVLQQLMARYDQKIRIVYKDFPLDNLHAQARAAAEAARCAGAQGKFWEYHDKVYGSPVDGSPARLKQFAQDLGLDAAQFDACQSSRKYQAAVQKDTQEGTGLGVTGTPGFFINGRFLSGAQPMETFTRIIDEELAKR